MASCGYHSPQFSEDIAWLPAWLQPHQHPAFGDGAKDEHHISQLSCKNLASLPKNMSNGRDNQLFTKWDGKYSGCRLYLSGDDNSPAGTIPSSTEALPFHLHLSSCSISQLSTSQLREIPHPGIHETNEGLPEKHFHEIPAVQAGALCQNKAEAEIPAPELPMRNKSRVSRRRISRPPINRKNQLRLCERPNTRNICNADINDAVELSIAASEAMVISEMVTSTFQSENLPAAAILEIALRVKQARKECSSDILEDVSYYPSDELGENDRLSDLDENTMADAFGDVGISLTQIVESPDNSHYSGKSLHSNPSCDLKTHISESHFGNKDEAQNAKLNAHDTIVSVAALAMDSVSKYLPLQPPPVKQARASALVHLDCTRSCLMSQPKVDAQNLEQNTDTLNPNQASCKEDQGIHKDGKASSRENETMRKSIIVFNRETSFISESMDEMDERMAGHTSHEEPEIVASSNTPFRNLSRFPYRESERSMYAGHNLSQDLVRSSISSLVDPLCSVVPCSISSEGVPISCDPYQDVTTEDGEKFMEPKRAIGSKEFNEKIMLLDLWETPSKTLVNGWPVLPKNNVEVPVVASRKQFNSLRHYSTVMPDPNNYKPPSQCTVKQNLQCSPAERNITCSLSNEPDAEISLKPINRCADVNVSQDKHGSGSKDQEEGSSVIGEAKDVDGELLIPHHEDIGPPIILNNKKRRLRACKLILNSDGDEASLENSSASKNRKCKIVTSTDGVKSSNLTNFISHNPMQSSLRSHPSDKESLKNKRVRFLEVKSNVDRTRSSNMLNSKRQSHASHRRSSRRVKKSSLPNKSSRKENELSFQSIVGEKGTIFLGLEFLLTGFAHQKEKELEALIRQYGGYVLINIPSDPPDLRGKQQARLARIKLPIVLSPKKVQTTKFLYGCAANTWMLNAHWLVDSIRAGSLLPPWKFMNRLIQVSEPNQLRITEPFCLINHTFIFESVGVMLNGKVSFCTKFSKIIKHGGGKVFKSLQRLVQSLKNETTALGLVLVENEGNVSRHLKHCALENDIQTMPASWMVNSLFSGKLLPIKKERYSPLHRIKMPTFSVAQDYDMSEEI